MLDKKRTIAVKSKPVDTRMSKPQATRSAKPAEKPAKAGPVTEVSDAAKQMAAFESAMKLFHARRLKEARDLFQQATKGPERDVAQRATLHIAMCDRRLEQPAPSLVSAEDHYNYAVAMINARKLNEARTHLEKALAMASGSDHIHYAMAVVLSLSGDLYGAHESLRRAIEIEPRNRLTARQDADLSALANSSQYSSLIFPERK
jgi:tetratricopeptide (TPR) repeat protein